MSTALLPALKMAAAERPCGGRGLPAEGVRAWRQPAVSPLLFPRCPRVGSPTGMEGTGGPPCKETASQQRGIGIKTLGKGLLHTSRGV